jgi:hypothetical protein
MHKGESKSNVDDLIARFGVHTGAERTCAITNTSAKVALFESPRQSDAVISSLRSRKYIGQQQDALHLGPRSVCVSSHCLMSSYL